MFPAEIARAAHETLAGAGADIVYRELPDLSHTYPREENARMLRWMDPGLTLPGEA
jgi:phospholipase/carboxylesterase